MNISNIIKSRSHPFRIRMDRSSLMNSARWTVLLSLTVTVASLAPEFAFVSIVSPSKNSHSFSRSCLSSSFIRIPLEFPGESVCLPSYTVKRSRLDFFIPTVFSGLIVSGSAFVVRSLFYGERGNGGRRG